MKRITALLAVPLMLALLIPALVTHVAFASPSYKRSPSINTHVVMTYTFPITETGVDSLAFEVNGLCSVVYESAGSDDASLYAVETGETATGSGTLIVAYIDSSTAPTVFQPGTRWVRAVAVSATTGGSIMRITCSNTQLASTGEACGTSGLVPYVGTGGRYKCEQDLSYAEDDNELNVGSVLVDAVADKNVIAMEANSGYTGADPTSTQVLLYGLTSDTELYVENLDGIGVPSRVVTASPDYYDVVLEWGVNFSAIIDEYVDLEGLGEQKVNKFCMVKAPHVSAEKTLTTSTDVDQTAALDVVVPLTGTNGCADAQASTRALLAYPIIGDPYIQDVWCTSRSSLGGGTWRTGDEIVVEFSISNIADTTPDEFLSPAHTMTFGYDEIFVAHNSSIGRHYQLRDTVGAFASSFLTGTIDGDGVGMMIFTASIESMTRAVGSVWESVALHCMAGLQFRDTR